MSEILLFEDKKSIGFGQIQNESLLDAPILIVDDTEFSRFILREILNQNGFKHIYLATNGQEAIELCENVMPGVIILDIMMPVMDGFEFCKRLRSSNDRLREIPVIVQTALTQSADIVKAFDVGASDLVGKPINSQELIARVFVHLERYMLLKKLREYQERVKSELDNAREMQRMILPQKKLIQSIEREYNLSVLSVYETSSEMGGDFWGILPIIPGEKIGFYIVDFSGHGVTSAINTFRFHTMLNDCQELWGDPGKLFEELNSRLYNLMQRNHFATMFYGVIDNKKEKLHFATAASPAAVYFSHNNKEIEFISGEGFPLGVVDNTKYETKTRNFPKASGVITYSDALIETENEKGECITEKDISDFIISCVGEKPDSLMEKLEYKFRKHLGANILKDDLTINIFYRNA